MLIILFYHNQGDCQDDKQSVDKNRYLSLNLIVRAARWAAEWGFIISNKQNNKER
jgi:hypothetical protein